METTEDILNLIKSSTDNRVKIAIADIDGVLRGKIIHKDKFIDAASSDIGFCDVVFGWDMVDEAYDNAKVTGWHTGYPDAKARIDLSTMRRVPWEEEIPFFIADFAKSDHPACPRNLLKKVIEKGNTLGFKAFFSEEFEWFNFKEDPGTFDASKAPTPISSGMFGYSLLRASQNSEFFSDLFILLDQFDIPIEGIHTETGPGVYEAAILYTDTLEAADRAVLFKTAVKEIAGKYGIMASFMAKWNEKLPGCSGHIHQSLWKDGKNVFFDAQKENKVSELLEHYIAGQLKCLPEILPMYAPTINSYKRLVEGAWAPTTITWGIDNRTNALRVINNTEKSMRLETRVPGSDVNPYLAMSAAYASGLYGIEHKLKLEVPPTRGNGYLETAQGQLPTGLAEATSIMKSSGIAKELFGEPFVDHFTSTREWECRQYRKAVTDWELKRYFEII